MAEPAAQLAKFPGSGRLVKDPRNSSGHLVKRVPAGVTIYLDASYQVTHTAVESATGYADGKATVWPAAFNTWEAIGAWSAGGSYGNGSLVFFDYDSFDEEVTLTLTRVAQRFAVPAARVGHTLYNVNVRNWVAPYRDGWLGVSTQDADAGPPWCNVAGALALPGFEIDTTNPIDPEERRLSTPLVLKDYLFIYLTFYDFEPPEAYTWDTFAHWYPKIVTALEY